MDRGVGALIFRLEDQARLVGDEEVGVHRIDVDNDVVEGLGSGTHLEGRFLEAHLGDQLDTRR